VVRSGERPRAHARQMTALVVLLWFLCVVFILGVVFVLSWILVGVSRFP